MPWIAALAAIQGFLAFLDMAGRGKDRAPLQSSTPAQRPVGSQEKPLWQFLSRVYVLALGLQ